MNLLEHYIEEVYDVKTVDMKDGNDNIIMSFIAVDMMVECYGRHQRVQTSFANMEEWEAVKEQGYYMA